RMTSLLDLSSDVVALISEYLDSQSRADLMMTHPSLARGVWLVENRLVMKCIKAGVTLPSKELCIFAARRGLGVDYRSICVHDTFGSNLYRLAWQGPDHLTTTTLPIIRDSQGRVIKHVTTGLRPNNPSYGVVGHAFSSGRLQLELQLNQVGVSSWMLSEGRVRITVNIRGVKAVSESDIVAGGALKSDNAQSVHLETVSRTEQPPIEGWGADVDMQLASPPVVSVADLSKLRLLLTFFSDFVLCTVEIFAVIV
ncbi:hypothetical protein PFISCL1PPCAC_7931, partial [Pristionchus fissidentatus]